MPGKSLLTRRDQSTKPRAVVKTLIKLGLVLAMMTAAAVLANASAIWGS